MSRKWRRFEVLIPVRFNDGREVPDDWLAEAFNEIVDHFGAAGFDTHRVQGRWRHEGVLFRDSLVRFVVDVADTLKNRQWMKRFKASWKNVLSKLTFGW
jgi:hypothetical protein